MTAGIARNSGDRLRQRVYAGLLLFVVVIGLPMVTVPKLRNRLFDRIHALKMAISGEIQPVRAQVGTNPNPFPEEFERPAPPPPDESKMAAVTRPPAPRKEPYRTSGPLRHIQIPPTPQAEENAPPLVREEESSDAAPKFQQGKLEQDAYQLVLKNNKTLADMVQGGNPSLRFKTWDAAHRGEDIYWVRVTFQQQGKPDVEYIWQVKLNSGEVSPLSFNARGIS